MGIIQKTGKYPEVTLELIEHLNDLIDKHTQLLNLPIYNDTLLVTDTEQQGKESGYINCFCRYQYVNYMMIYYLKVLFIN